MGKQRTEPPAAHPFAREMQAHTKRSTPCTGGQKLRHASRNGRFGLFSPEKSKTITPYTVTTEGIPRNIALEAEMSLEHAANKRREQPFLCVPEQPKHISKTDRNSPAAAAAAVTSRRCGP